MLRFLPRALTVTVMTALLAMAAARAEHTGMVRPTYVGLPPVPPAVGPRGTAYRYTRSKGFVRMTDECVHMIAFTNLFGLTVSDQRPGTGDEIICLTDLWMDVGGPAFGTLVRRADVRSRSGSRTRVRDLAKLDAETPLCRPGSGDTWYELRGTRCYEPDSSFWPAITVPFATDPAQGFVLGAYAPRPASDLIAIEGNARKEDLRQ